MPSLDPSLPEGTIVCLDCDYQLQGLTSNRCPECGRAFDPENKESFHVVSYNWDLWLKVAMGLVVGLTLANVGIWWLASAGIPALYYVGTFFLTIALMVDVFSLFCILGYAQESRQPRGMKWVCTLISLGVVLGTPILGIGFLLSRAF